MRFFTRKKSNPNPSFIPPPVEKKCEHKFQDFPWYIEGEEGDNGYTFAPWYHLVIKEPYVCIYCGERHDKVLWEIKRYGNHTLKASHGTGPVARHAGSMAGASDPSRIPKGKKMPGHMGAERVTIQNLVIAKIDVENNLIAIKGAIPGPKGGVVTITSSIKKA